MTNMSDMEQQDTINPFKDDVSLNCLQWFKIVIMTFTLAPIKCFMLSCTALTMWALSCLGLCCLSATEVNQIRFAGCLKCLQACVYCLMRILFFWFGVLFVRIKGESPPAKKAPIIVCAPHSTVFDAIATGLVRGSPVAKISIKNAPIVGKVLTFLQAVFVDRDNQEQCKEARSLIEMRTERAAAETGWRRMFLFPEGTTTNAKALIPFKCGAFSPAYPVLPILLRVSGEPEVYRCTWDRTYGELVSFWFVLCQMYVCLHVEFLPTYTPNDEEKADPKLYANNVRKLMAKKLGIPLSDMTYEDAKML